MVDRPLRKLCLLGDFRVGKTRLVCRLTDCLVPPPAFGVHLHYWRSPSAPEVEFALFDVAGRSSLDSLGQSFLSGAEGFALVADSSDPDSIDVALQLNRRAQELVGPLPSVLILNKSDQALAQLTSVPDNMPVFRVSALRGEGVADAFADLADRVLHAAAAAAVAGPPIEQTCGVP